MDKVLNVLSQSSTWKGLSLIVGSLAISISPAMIMEFGTAVATFIGLIDVIRDER